MELFPPLAILGAHSCDCGDFAAELPHVPEEDSTAR